MVNSPQRSTAPSFIPEGFSFSSAAETASHLFVPTQSNPTPDFVVSTDPFRFGSSPGGQRRGEPPIAVADYIKKTSRFDSKRFAVILAIGVEARDPGKNKRGRDASWNSRWLHAPCRIRRSSNEFSDLEYLRVNAEEQYFRKALRILESSTGNTMGVHKVGFSYPFFSLYWLDRNRWGRFQADESRMRARKDKLPHCWHNTEFFDVPYGERDRLYPKQPEWWREYDVSQWLGVATPPVVAYFGSAAFSEEYHDCFCSMVASEWVVSVFVAFIDAAENGVHPSINSNFDKLRATSYVRSKICTTVGEVWISLYVRFDCFSGRYSI